MACEIDFRRHACAPGIQPQQSSARFTFIGTRGSRGRFFFNFFDDFDTFTVEAAPDDFAPFAPVLAEAAPEDFDLFTFEAAPDDLDPFAPAPEDFDLVTVGADPGDFDLFAPAALAEAVPFEDVGFRLARHSPSSSHPEMSMPIAKTGGLGWRLGLIREVACKQTINKPSTPQTLYSIV